VDVTVEPNVQNCTFRWLAGIGERGIVYIFTGLIIVEMCSATKYGSHWQLEFALNLTQESVDEGQDANKILTRPSGFACSKFIARFNTHLWPGPVSAVLTRQAASRF
jgi:hypothetical protein